MQEQTIVAKKTPAANELVLDQKVEAAAMAVAPFFGPLFFPSSRPPLGPLRLPSAPIGFCASSHGGEQKNQMEEGGGRNGTLDHPIQMAPIRKPPPTRDELGAHVLVV